LSFGAKGSAELNHGIKGRMADFASAKGDGPDALTKSESGSYVDN